MTSFVQMVFLEFAMSFEWLSFSFDLILMAVDFINFHLTFVVSERPQYIES